MKDLRNIDRYGLREGGDIPEYLEVQEAYKKKKKKKVKGGAQSTPKSTQNDIGGGAEGPITENTMATLMNTEKPKGANDKQNAYYEGGESDKSK